MKLQAMILLTALLLPARAKRAIMIARRIGWLDDDHAEFLIVVLGLEND